MFCEARVRSAGGRNFNSFGGRSCAQKAAWVCVTQAKARFGIFWYARSLKAYTQGVQYTTFTRSMHDRNTEHRILKQTKFTKSIKKLRRKKQFDSVRERENTKHPLFPSSTNLPKP